MADNKRIARNTLFLALRMPFVLVVNLFTSRVVLQELGTVDFGVYQVVAGFILLIAFINSAMTVTVQRFMNVEMVKGDKADMQGVFAASCKCILLVGVLFVVFAETAGLLMLQYVIDIPEARVDAAFWVYQFAVLTMLIEFMRVPYFSMLVAHERFQFYSYHTIADGAFKLTVAIMLFMIPNHKLVVYAAMLVGVALLLNAILVAYNNYVFPGIRFSLRAPWKRVREIGGFVGWTSLGSVSSMVYQQGGNLVLNVFFGVTLNATMGIVNQVKSGITLLARNLMFASSPQIIKSYSAGNTSDFRSLFTRTTRLLYFIVLFFGLPVMFNAQFILDFWLGVGHVPPFAALFMVWIVVYCLVDVLGGPLDTCIYACGKVGKYQVMQAVMSVIYLVALYVAYRLGGQAVWVIVMLALINVLVMAARFWFVSRYCDVPLWTYLSQAILPMAAVTAVCIVLPVVTAVYMQPGTARFFATCGVSVVSTALTVYWLGFNGRERKAVIGKIRKILHL